jgi:maltose O-acetyltransferase
MTTILRIRKEIWYNISGAYHFFARNIPNSRIKKVFYRLRGTKIGKNVDIAQCVFLEDVYPELITIGDNVDLGPSVIIVTHDSCCKCVCKDFDLEVINGVIIESNVYIGAGAIILPGVRIGHHSIIGAGAVVTKNIPPNSVAFGIPAKVQNNSMDWYKKKKISL